MLRVTFHLPKSVISYGLILCLALSQLTVLPTANTQAANSNYPYKANQLIVKFRQGVSEREKHQFMGQHHVSSIRKFKIIKAELVRLRGDKPLEVVMNEMKQSKLISYAEPNYQVKRKGNVSSLAKAYRKLGNDPMLGKQWGLRNTGKNGKTKGADIRAFDAWKIYTPRSPIVVAVIDSGVDLRHRELSSNIWVNSGEDLNRDGKISDNEVNGVDDDNNGYIDDFRGWDFANWDNSAWDDNEHGTHVAGIIAARGNNSYGVVGVAGQGEVKIMPLKFLDANGEGYTSDAISALEYAQANGAYITNNSWGGAPFEDSLFEAIKAYNSWGGIFVVAAGNDGTNIDSRPDYPASYNVSNNIVVAATNSSDKLAYFSNFGRRTVDISAPGQGILSTVPGNKFVSMDGTSMATPFVVGVCALVWNQNPNITAAQVRQIVLNRSRKVKGLDKVTVTGGVVNAYSAVNAAK